VSVTLMAVASYRILPPCSIVSNKGGSIHLGLGTLFWRHLSIYGEFHQASLFSFRRPQCVSFRVESTPERWPRSMPHDAYTR